MADIKSHICPGDRKDNSHDKKNEKISFDDLLVKLGTFGRYQKFIYILIVIPAICQAFPIMSLVFTLGSHDHRCAVPGIVNDTYTQSGEEIAVITNSSVGDTIVEMYSQCTITTNNSLSNISTTTTSKCDSWVYDKRVYQTTIISDFNLVCDNVVLQSHAMMLSFCGALVGGVTLMPLADIFGRKKIICLALAMMFVSNIALVWVPNIWCYILFSFLYGMSGPAYWGLAIVTALELVHPSKRELAGVSINYFWCLGEFILAGLAYWLRNWRHLQLATSIPFGLFIVYYFLLDESPRWLLAKGRKKEAQVIIKKIAKMNNVAILEDEVKSVYDPTEQNKSVSMLTSCRHVLRSFRVSSWVAIVYFNMLAIYIGYVGISLNIGLLSGNIYINYSISCLVELIGYMICHLLLNRIGRRPLLCSSMIVGGVALLCAVFVVIVFKDAPSWINTALVMIGKLAVSCAIALIFIFEGEIYPTTVRSFLQGGGTTSGQIGSMVSPYIGKINNLIQTDLGSSLDLVLFGIMMFSAGLSALILPETRNKKLPDTIEEANQLKEL